MAQFTFRIVRFAYGFAYVVLRDGAPAAKRQSDRAYRTEREAANAARRAIKRYQQQEL